MGPKWAGCEAKLRRSRFSPPDGDTAITTSRTRTLLLRELFGLDRTPHHMRHLARRTGLSVTAVRKELQALVAADLVEQRRDSNRLYFRAREEHPIFPELHSLVLKTIGLRDVLAARLDGADILVAFVFGSISRGEERASSDIDLMVIGGVGLRDISRLLSGVGDILFREVNAHALTATEFRRRLAAGEHFLTQVLACSKLFVIGDEHALAAVGKELMGQD